MAAFGSTAMLRSSSLEGPCVPFWFELVGFRREASRSSLRFPSRTTATPPAKPQTRSFREKNGPQDYGTAIPLSRWRLPPEKHRFLCRRVLGATAKGRGAYMVEIAPSTPLPSLRGMVARAAGPSQQLHRLTICVAGKLGKLVIWYRRHFVSAERQDTQNTNTGTNTGGRTRERFQRSQNAFAYKMPLYGFAAWTSPNTATTSVTAQ